MSEPYALLGIGIMTSFGRDFSNRDAICRAILPLPPIALPVHAVYDPRLIDPGNRTRPVDDALRAPVRWLG